MALSLSVARQAAVASFSQERTGQLASSRNGVCAPTLVLAPRRATPVSKRVASLVVSASAAAERVPDENRRFVMNLLLLGAVSGPSLGVLGPYLYFFVPPSTGGGGAGIIAKDALGNDLFSKTWLKTHSGGDRTLVQGLKGDPTYLVVENDGTLGTYGINAVCTHLGCVVPFNVAENKFICPCHGSQYNNQGRVVRGPAPLSLALAHSDVNVDDDKIILSPWVETDFRTGEEPWWS